MLEVREGISHLSRYISKEEEEFMVQANCPAWGRGGGGLTKPNRQSGKGYKAEHRCRE